MPKRSLEPMPTLTAAREVVSHTPIVAAGERAGSSFPVAVSISIGTSMAIVLTA